MYIDLILLKATEPDEVKDTSGQSTCDTVPCMADSRPDRLPDSLDYSYHWIVPAPRSTMTRHWQCPDISTRPIGGHRLTTPC